MHFRNRFWLKALTLAVAYFGCSMVARLLKADPHWLSLVWLPWGLLFGVLSVSERREWIWLILATAPADYLFNFIGPDIPILIWSLGRGITYASTFGGAWLVQKLGHGPARLRSVRDLLVLFAAGFGAQAISAAGFAICQHALGVKTDFAQLWLRWFMINILGFSFLTTGIIFWCDRAWLQIRSSIKAGVVEIVCVLVAYGVIVEAANAGVTIGVAGAQSAMLVLVVWAALRVGSLGTVAVEVLIIALTSFFPIRTYGLITGDRSLEAGNLVLLIGVVVVSVVGVLIAVAIESERRSEMLLVENNAALKEALAAKEQQTAELKDTNTLLQKVLQQSEQMARDLGVANKALSMSNRAKLELVRALSHELRNPLAGARMMAATLTRVTGDAQHDRQISNLRSCIDYLKILLDETLDLTQVESGQVAIRMEPFTTTELLQEVGAIFESIAQEKQLAFTLDPGPEPDRLLLGDKTHTKRIIINYLSNAFKFTSHGSVVLRAVALAPFQEISRLRFEVNDTGPGVSPAIQARLFGRFIRESSRVKGDSMLGAGLGLALCKQLAELAGGTVGFASRAGEGSSFWAELPFITYLGEHLPKTELMEAQPDFSDLSVCLIDDDPLQLEALSSVLGHFGLVPDTRQSAEDGLDLLKRKRFNVVFSDYHIAEETGIQMLRRIREQCSPDDLRHTQFHLVTALEEENLAERAKAVGFYGVHRKPLSLVTLFQIFQAARLAKAVAGS